MNNVPFSIGCNYWASHAGTHMWSDWQENVVAEDFKKLSQHGIKVLRVFPLWSDFQPISTLYRGGGAPYETRIGEEALGADDAGKAGVSTVMMERFDRLAQLARQESLQLIVGLVTGWMSGRLFVPPALQGKNILTDSDSLMWQRRFVRYFVSRAKHHEAIIAWDLGNECNAMAPVKSRSEAYVWTSMVADAIRLSDNRRPVISGMHSLAPHTNWTQQDQGELTDILTVHPYPSLWNPYCDSDPIDTIKSLLNPAAQNTYYSGVGGKPCMVEEIGTFSPMVGDEETVARMARTALFSAWAHNSAGLLWWCYSDQLTLPNAPYDWCGCERELGLFKTDGTPKRLVGELTHFAQFLDDNQMRNLPRRTLDAVCILTEEQDTWGVVYSSAVLAKQAGMELDYQYMTQELKEASIYLVPCIMGANVIRRSLWLKLLRQAEAGATLYISYEGGIVSPFEEVTGLFSSARQRRGRVKQGRFVGLNGQPTLPLGGSHELLLRTGKAKALAVDEDDNVVFSVADYGKGKVFFLNAALETYLQTQQQVFLDETLPYYAIYKAVYDSMGRKKVIAGDDPYIGITEHKMGAETACCVLINYSPRPRSVQLTVAANWVVIACLHGTYRERQASLQANDAVVLLLRRAAP